MGRLKLFIPLIIFLLLAAFFLVIELRIKDGEYNPEDLPSARIDKPVPNFSLPLLESQQVVDQSIFSGKVQLINVWATWCISCRVEHPYLVELAEQKGIAIVGLNYKDERQKALAWLEEYGDPYSMVIEDVKGKLGLDLGVFGAPETYLVDAQGIVRYRHVGVLNEKVWTSAFVPVLKTLSGTQ